MTLTDSSTPTRPAPPNAMLFSRHRFDTQVNISRLPVSARSAEISWLPLLGPSAMAILRRLDLLMPADEKDALTVDSLIFGKSVGVGGTRLRATLERLVKFKAATWLSESRQLYVVDALPRLRARQLDEMEPRLRWWYWQCLAEEGRSH